MPDPESEGRDPSGSQSRSPGRVDDTSDERTEARSGPPSSFDLLRRVVVGVVEAVGEGVELVSASVREELARSRVEIERRLKVLLLMAAGAALVSTGVMLVLRDLIGSWAPTLLLLGGAHLAAGFWLSHRWREGGAKK